MKLRKIVGIAMLLLMLGCQSNSRQSTIRSDQIGDEVTILGKLGLPVGQETTISGTKNSVGPIMDMFTVKMIDGRPAPDGLRIQVNGIANWPDGTSATLRGNEIGTVAFLYLYMTNYGFEDDRWTGPHQSMFLHFDVAEVVEPNDLKIDLTGEQAR